MPGSIDRAAVPSAFASAARTPAIGASSAIAVQNLTKSYGGNRAVQGISFEVLPGEVFSLLGPNGAGKTTTIAMISCLLAPDAGDVLVLGHSVREEPGAVKPLIGVVPQEIAIYTDLSARENLTFWGKMQGLRGDLLRARVNEVLEAIGLTDRQRGATSRFSGGMKRRLNIGIALLHHPRILIMDEPTVGIDPQSRRSILDSILSLRAQGSTILYTTHYMEEAQELSDHIAIMDRGRIVAAGTHAELVRLMGELDRLELAIDAPVERVADLWRGVEGIASVAGENGRLTVLAADSNRALPRLVEVANGAGVRVTSVEIHEPNLEAVFLHLTGRALRD